MSRRPSPALIRPIPFSLALFLAAFNLSMALLAPKLRDALAIFLISGVVVAGGIVFWMLVLVRGDHGLMGPIVGVRKDGELKLPRATKMLFALGAGMLVFGLSIQSASRAGIWLFAAGIALMGAASTQFRCDLSD